MVVFEIAAVVAQRPHLFGQVWVVGGDTARVAQRAQVFARIEAEPGGIAQAARPAALPGGAVGLGRVLDDLEAVGLGNGADFVHGRALAVEVHRHDGLGAGGDGGLDAVGVDVVGGQVGFHKDRRGPRVADGQRRGNKGVGGHDDLVPRPDAERLEDQHQGVQPVAAAHAVVHAAVGGKRLFKGGVLPPVDIPTVLQHTVKGRAQVPVQFPLHGAERDKRHRDRLLTHCDTPRFYEIWQTGTRRLLYRLIIQRFLRFRNRKKQGAPGKRERPVRIIGGFAALPCGWRI